MNKKLFSSTFIIFIVVFGLIVTGVGWVDVVRASTQVAGIIGSDTTWTPANSPYNFTAPVLVQEGVTLTIQPGVVVNIGPRYLMVNGTLNARGDSVHPITFNANPDHIGPPSIQGSIIFAQSSRAWNEQTGSGCIIENAVVYALLTLDATIKLDNDTFYDKITMETGTGTSIISNNIIKHGIDVGPWGGTRNDVSVVISNNTVMNGKITISFPSTGSIIVSNNTCFWEILVAKFAYSSGTFVPIIENNLLVNNLVGIGILDSGAGMGPIIRNNTITNNTYGILISYSSPPHSHDLTCSNNNIYGNTDYNVKTQDSANINLANNWWGTTNSSAISESMYDYDNDFTLGAVNFLPFLDSPNLQAPSPTLTINASSGLGGSINPKGLVPVNYGSNQTFGVTANPGYQIDRVLMDGKPASAPYTFYNVTSVGHTISVTFKLIPPIPEDGIIATNTTWTKTNSPYTLARNVLINHGVTLTIEAGATVNLNGYYIMVNGTLNARGNSADRINFVGGQITFTEYSTDWNESIGVGSIIENAILSSRLEISSSLKIANNSIKGITASFGAINIVGDSPIIIGNTFSNNLQGIYITGGNGMGSSPYSCSPFISENIFSNNSQGIYVSTLSYTSGTATITKNLISGNYGQLSLSGLGSSAGIYVGYGITPSYITNISNNTVYNNTVGIWINGSPLTSVTQNNIFGNTDFDLRRETSDDISIANNWWGTTNSSLIDQHIYDFYDDFQVGKVVYVPFLNSPNIQAPAVPTFMITASSGTGGSISPNGTVTVTYGDSQTFNVTANPGYEIVSVLLDGKPSTAPYAFNNITSNGHTISATFQQTIIPKYSPHR